MQQAITSRVTRGRLGVLMGITAEPKKNPSCNNTSGRTRKSKSTSVLLSSRCLIVVYSDKTRDAVVALGGVLHSRVDTAGYTETNRTGSVCSWPWGDYVPSRLGHQLRVPCIQGAINLML